MHIPYLLLSLALAVLPLPPTYASTAFGLAYSIGYFAPTFVLDATASVYPESIGSAFVFIPATVAAGTTATGTGGSEMSDALITYILLKAAWLRCYLCFRDW